MTRHLPLLPCLLGLALCIWRPEWVSVAVLALCLCFAMYLDNRGRRAEDVEDLQERLGSVAMDAHRATAALESNVQALREGLQKLAGAGAQEHSTVLGELDALRHDQKKLRGDMEALRVALGAKPGRPGL